MERIARFYKVSREQFVQDWKDTFGEGTEEAQILEIYEGIQLPRRATSGSAGYDIFLPDKICLEPGQSVKVPTGIRAEIDEGWVLQIYPRSGLGFKYRLQLNNTVGIIDSDYFFSDNEGHIQIKVMNDSREGKTVELAGGMAFAQGIFMGYGITVDDDCSGHERQAASSTGGQS